MSRHIPKSERVASLAAARTQLLARFHSATKELETVTEQLDIINSQLLILEGLVDPAPEEPDGTE